MCHFICTHCKRCGTLIRRHGVNCGHGLTVLGPPGLTYECASLADNTAPDIIVENGLCNECKVEAGEDYEQNVYRDLLSRQAKRKY
jgi:hypothetical protein